MSATTEPPHGRIDRADGDDPDGDRTRASSTGTVLSAADWLDDHFEACRDAYEAMAAAAGFETGSRVIDLGSGTGIFTPLLRRAVGTRGQVAAVDIDLENLRHVRRHDASAQALVGSALAIPVRDGAFDGLWAANLTQSLDDAALEAALREMMRVVRPGGLVAIKDVDMAAFRFSPASPFLGPHLAEACATATPVAAESVGSVRGRDLRRWLHRAGLVDTSQRTFVIEYPGALEGSALRLWGSWLPYLAALAEAKGVPVADLETWRQVASPQDARAFVSRPDFHGSEVQVVALGRVP
ncbi:MAG: methyltransferase domain-containing protein [Dehalococcoidia bacterium]|nr:methyltransferase domain-containing protein [Dehalococcoidia bacterium]